MGERMDREALNDQSIENVRQEPGAYRIWSGDHLLWVGSTIDDLKKALRHILRGFQQGVLQHGIPSDGMDTEVYRYFEQGYTTQYPVDSLQFDYLPTYKRTARALRKQWRDDYKAQHGGQLPPLDGHKR